MKICLKEMKKASLMVLFCKKREVIILFLLIYFLKQTSYDINQLVI